VLIAADPVWASQWRVPAQQEAAAAFALFRGTLHAFAQGGEAVGGNGAPVTLEATQGRAADLVRQAQRLVQDWPSVPDDPGALARFRDFMVASNLAILDDMNQLTSELEHQSLAATQALRLAQTIMFCLSLLNFFGIFWQMRVNQKTAETAALTDKLTGLLNRAGIYGVLQTCLRQRQQHPVKHDLAVLLIDLDGFKGVNDTIGHLRGDSLLVEVAGQLRQWAGDQWQCGRLGGDEFVLIGQVSASTCLASQSFALTTHLTETCLAPYAASASIGYAVAQADSTADSLVGMADRVMYEIKADHHRIHRYRGDTRPQGLS
jgi:diguanylate cyclase (GGDEF)-like protein